jgi:2-hydroxy-3-keto-5-methylthiopentenyl-1-phosphate phosphatase
MARIMIGDGRSDFCVSERVDYVLAKASLLKHAVAKDLPHAAYADFKEAKDLLAQWLAEQALLPGTVAKAVTHHRAR